MKPYYVFFALIIFAACKPKPVKVVVNADAKQVRVLPASYKTSNVLKSSVADTTAIDEQIDAYADYYVLIADTGKNYTELRAKMFNLHQSTDLVIDTMGRTYDKVKGLIALPDDSEDDIYAGEYYPRRYPSENLSLEYLSQYSDKAGLKTMALVAGIYENKTKADSALTNIKTGEKAFVLKSKIYVGCMH